MNRIEQFLPPRFRSKKIKNFLQSTTQELFNPSDVVNNTYFVGRTPSGLYNHTKDYYIPEVRKIREDYQLEPTLVINGVNGDVQSSLFYEDFLNVLKDSGFDITNHGKLLQGETLTYTPPIDYDMFVNYRDYYWYPEYLSIFRTETKREVVEGKITATVPNAANNDSVMRLTNGMLVRFGDDNGVYRVEGVGRSIELHLLEDLDPVTNEQDLSWRVNYNEHSNTILEKFPKEYITMSRYSYDSNTWSRHNAWVHKDAIVGIIESGEVFRVDSLRGANRPIICFDRNLKLFNLEGEFKGTVDYVFDDGDIHISTLPEGSYLRMDDTGNNGKVIIRTGSSSYTQESIPDGRYTITKGSHAGDEYLKDGVDVILQQSKPKPTTPILFDLFDDEGISKSDDIKYPNNTFSGSKIFSYLEDDEYGIFDKELGMSVSYSAGKESSEIMFSSYDCDCNYQIVGGDVQSNILKFTYNTYEGREEILINGEYSPDILVEPNTSYIIDIADLSFSTIGWFGKYNYIEIVDENDEILLERISSVSSNAITEVVFELGKTYYYTNGVIKGTIHVTPSISTNTNKALWVDLGKENITILQKHILDQTGKVQINYQPKNTKLDVLIGGASIGEERINIRGREMTIDGTKEGDYIEVRYNTLDKISPFDKESVQEIHRGITNNPYNENISSFTFSLIIPHFLSKISAQPYLEGSAFSTNNYRDTVRNNNIGGTILRHKYTLPTLMFMLQDNKYRFEEVVEFVATSYEGFKQSLIFETENIMRYRDIQPSNAFKTLDDIIYIVNQSKSFTDPFSKSRMIVVGEKYTKFAIQSDGSIPVTIDLEDEDSALCVITNNGLMMLDIDYTLSIDELTNFTVITPITFNLYEVNEVRLYESLESSYCPPTPSKMGLTSTFKPMIYVDETFMEDVLVIRGHDGSISRANGDIASFMAGIYDPRDLIILEFEKRVYNNIKRSYRINTASKDIKYNTNGVFRNNLVDKSVINKLEFAYFNKWVSNNYVDYKLNTLYEDGNPFTYNYPEFEYNGLKMSGNYKQIYTQLFDSSTPHLTPWELLGFSVEPIWWKTQYGSIYASTNINMWSDLEKGIIRQGARENFSDDSYLINNKFARNGLLDILPVDHNGKLLNPIEIGIVDSNTLYYEDIGRAWSFGENGSVELSWRNSSIYKFIEQIVSYHINPLKYVSISWNVEESYSEPLKKIPHSLEKPVLGISQWIHDYLNFKQYDVNDHLLDSFKRQEIKLAHKVGGYIDGNNTRIFVESLTKSASRKTNLMPHEDIEIILHESREISRHNYSGVIIERIEDTNDIYVFKEGIEYSKGEVIYNNKTGFTYEYANNISINDWRFSTFYIQGIDVRFQGQIYTATQAHRADVDNDPSFNSGVWKLKEFRDSEWLLVPNERRSKKTNFKIHGYDLKNPYFVTIKGDDKGITRTITTPSRKSKPLAIVNWSTGIEFSKGQMFKAPNGQYIRMLSDGTTGEEPIFGTFETYKDGNLMSNMLRQEVFEENLIINGETQYEVVYYDTVFSSISSVVNFLIDYSRHLVKEGWVFNTTDERRSKLSDWYLMCEDFMQWANETTSVGAFITLSPAAEHIKFKTKHGVPSVTRDGEIMLMNHKFQLIESDFEVLRLDDTFSLVSPEPVYFCSIGVREYEHAIFVNNKTIFGDIIYDTVYGSRKERLKINTTRTKEWNGRLHANGFLVVNNSLIPNFDTTAFEMGENTNVDYINVNPIINKLKYHNIGFRERDYMNELEYETKSQVSFYKGFIKSKGSLQAIESFLRSESLVKDGWITVSEDWMFKQGEFGAINSRQSIEINIDAQDVQSNKQRLYLTYGKHTHPQRSKTVLYADINDRDTWTIAPTRFTPQGNLFKSKEYQPRLVKSAGWVVYSDVDLITFDFSKLDNKVIDTDYKFNINDRLWVASSETNNNEWSTYVLQEADISPVCFLTTGQKDKCSFIIRVDTPVDETAVYAIYNENYTYTFQLLNVEDDYYIARSFDKRIITIQKDVDISSLQFLKWIPSRIEDIASIGTQEINQYITEGSIVYSGDDSQWYAHKYTGGNWIIHYQSKDIVDTFSINRAILYNTETGKIESELRLYDPLEGLYPNDSIKYIDIYNDYDPAIYDTTQGYGMWGSNTLGKIWWDTSKAIYLNYKIGSEDYRATYWGSLFPESTIDIYEWVESIEPPEEGKYVTEKSYNQQLGMEVTRYYHWIKNSNVIPENSSRLSSTYEISKFIENAQVGNDYICILSNKGFLIGDNSNTLKSNVTLQIEYSIGSSESNTYTQWEIVTENTSNDIPESLLENLTDSIVGFDKNDVMIPNPNLSNLNRYGNGGGKTWFANIKQARKLFMELINAFTHNTNLNDVNVHWNTLFTIDNYFTKQHDWYDPSLPSDYEEFLITDRNNLVVTKLKNNDYVRVMDVTNGVLNGEWVLFQYRASDRTYIKVGESNATFTITDNFYMDDLSLTDSKYIREVIDVVFNRLFIKPFDDRLKPLFFEMIRYIIAEQNNVDWFFPSSYISIHEQSNSISTYPTYNADKDELIIKFIEEAKPYHSKIREYTKSNDYSEAVIGTIVTDFDKPVFITEMDRGIINLDENLIDLLEGDGATTQFRLKNFHDIETLKVYIDGVMINNNEFEIYANFYIIFNDAPRVGVHSKYNIVVISDNKGDVRNIESFNETKNGYATVYKTPLNKRVKTINTKAITQVFNRVSYEHTVPLYELHRIIQDGLETHEVYEYLRNLETNKLNATDMLIFSNYLDELIEIGNTAVVYDANNPAMVGFEANNIIVSVISKRHQDLYSSSDMSIVTEDDYKTHQMNEVFLQHGQYSINETVSPFELTVNINTGYSKIVVYKKDLVDNLIGKLITHQGLTKPLTEGLGSINFSFTLNPNNNYFIEEYTSNFVDYVNEIEQTLDGGGFGTASNSPEELVGVSYKEAIITSFNNNLSLSKLDFDTTTGLPIFETVTFTASNPLPTSYTISNSGIDNEHVMLIVNGDIWGYDVQYTIVGNTLNFIKPLNVGDKVIITDRFASFDHYPSHVIENHSNLNIGGYDGNIIMPQYLSGDDSRMYVVYTTDKTYVFETNETRQIVAKVDNTITINSGLNIPSDYAVCVLLYKEHKCENGQLSVVSYRQEFVVVEKVSNTEFNIVKRGLFNNMEHDIEKYLDNSAYSFTKYSIELHTVDSNRELSALTVVDRVIGQGEKRNSYPKYGFVIVGSDDDLGAC